eukprot:2707613-Alexandrium_andersonii.AAC.1
MVAAGNSRPDQIRDARHYLRSIARMGSRADHFRQIRHVGNPMGISAREMVTRPYGFAPRASPHGRSGWVHRETDPGSPGVHHASLMLNLLCEPAPPTDLPEISSKSWD